MLPETSTARTSSRSTGTGASCARAPGGSMAAERSSAWAVRLKRLRGFQNLLDMPGNLNFAPNARDLSVGTDQDGCTIDAHVFAAVHAFFDPGAVGFADRADRSEERVVGKEGVSRCRSRRVPYK